jgi:uncharacterized protein (TIRG00374 family)
MKQIRRALVLLVVTIGLSISAIAFWNSVSLFGFSPEDFLRLLQGKAQSIFLAVLLVFVGHLLRAKRSSTLLSTIHPCPFFSSFSALMIGNLYNTIFPFRAGELVRAHELGKMAGLSRIAVFCSIVLERLFDIAVLLLVALFLATNLDGFGFTILSLAVALIVGVSIFAFVVYPSRTRSEFVQSLSNLFNTNIREKIRLVFWSFDYSFGIFRTSKVRISYFLDTILMWFFYLGSIWILARSFVPSFTLAQSIKTSVLSYFAVLIPSGPGSFGTFHLVLSEGVAIHGFSNEALIPFSLLVWAVQFLPPAVLGLAFCIFGTRRDRLALPAQMGSEDKLRRDVEVTADFSAFLETYFSEKRVGGLIHQMELEGDFRFTRLLRGGSHATTILGWSRGKEVIRKVSLKAHSSKLADQCNWLRSRSMICEIPKIIAEGRSSQAYWFDMEYANGYKPFFDWLHSCSRDDAEKLIFQAIQLLEKKIHVLKAKKSDPKLLYSYSSEKILMKLEDTARISPVIRQLREYDYIEVNSRKLENVDSLLDKILNDDQMKADLFVFNESELHGDFTVDNLLTDGENIILLDPNGENQISDPIVDFAKLLQSLHSGYEFLCKVESAEVSGGKIKFDESKSSRYQELCDFVFELLKQNLEPSRYKAVLFHESVHYFRMLPYRANINPDSVAAFYAVAVRLLNDFTDQYLRSETVSKNGSLKAPGSDEQIAGSHF